MKRPKEDTKMRTLLTLTLVLMMAFICVACGAKDTGEKKEGSKPAASEKVEASSSEQQEQEESTPDPAPVEDEPDNSDGEEAADPGTSGGTEGSHELFDIEELAGVSEFPDFAKKAIGTLSWCDDLSRSMPQYEIYYNAYMKNVTQEDFETYIANLNANAPKDPVEGEEFVYYWDWGQIIGTYHPADGLLDVGLAIYEK